MTRHKRSLQVRTETLRVLIEVRLSEVVGGTPIRPAESLQCPVTPPIG